MSKIDFSGTDERFPKSVGVFSADAVQSACTLCTYGYSCMIGALCANQECAIGSCLSPSACANQNCVNDNNRGLGG